MDLGGFIDTYKEAIAKRVVASYPPLYRPSETGLRLPPLLRTPLGAQRDAILGAALSLREQRSAAVVGRWARGKPSSPPPRPAPPASSGCWSCVPRT